MKKLILTSLIACAMAATTVHATLIAFTNRAAWEAAVGGSFMEQNFDSYTSSTSYQGGAVDVGDFSVSMTGSDFGTIWHNIGPDVVGNSVNGTGQINVATGASGGTTLTWDSPIMAFGAYFKGSSDSRVTNILVNGEELSLTDTSAGFGFFGFVSDTAFSSEFFFLKSGAADGFGIDNVVYRAASSSVPDGAATIALIGGAMLGLAAFRRRFAAC